MSLWEIVWNMDFTSLCNTFVKYIYLSLIIHKNFKSSNILLDSEFNPHLSDAVLASFIPDAEFQVMVNILTSISRRLVA